MEAIPEDILRLIFTEYLRHHESTVLSLTPVCRTWYNILVSSPSYWSKVIINVHSIEMVPHLLKSSEFHQYLARSSPENDRNSGDTDVRGTVTGHPSSPLDIYITWHSSSNPGYDHSITCDTSPLEIVECPNSPCRLQPTRQEQLRDILIFLADGSTQPTGVVTPGASNSSAVGSAAANAATTLIRGSDRVLQRPIERWRSLSIDLYGMSDSISHYDEVTLEPFDSPSYNPINLSALYLRNITSYFGSLDDSFASNISSLELINSRIGQFGRLTTFAHLKTLTLTTPNLRQGFVSGASVFQNVVDFTILIPARSNLSFHLPKLKILRIHAQLPVNLYQDIHRQFQRGQNPGDSKSRCLEELHLHALSPETLATLSQSRLTTTSHSIFIYTSSSLRNEMYGNAVTGRGSLSQEDAGKDDRTTTSLAQLLSKCDDSCILSSGDWKAKALLEEAKGMLEYFLDPLTMPSPLYTSKN